MIQLDNKTCVVTTDEITLKISEMFDYKFDGKSVFTFPIIKDIPDNFNIGLIVGPSGSGKSSLLNAFGKEIKVEWDNTKAIVSHFTSAQEAQECLSSVGFNTIPSWLKPYSVLSTGEKFRADLSRSIQSNCVVDEFTSVVDRTVAKSCSVALSKFIRNKNIKNVVFASCHYDIIEWLQPDWVFDTATNCVARGLERRPPIKLEIIPCGSEAWSVFSKHHYLNDKINKAAHCWLTLWENKPVGFVSSLSYPSGTTKNAWREHRTVVLPDYQGLGIGVKMSDAVAELFLKNGKRYFSKTAHPRMGEYRNNSPLWKATSKNMKARPDYLYSNKSKEEAYKHLHVNRICYSHEYIGNNDK